MGFIVLWKNRWMSVLNETQRVEATDPLQSKAQVRSDHFLSKQAEGKNKF
jgi:hypothetical protein